MQQITISREYVHNLEKKAARKNKQVEKLKLEGRCTEADERTLANLIDRTLFYTDIMAKQVFIPTSWLNKKPGGSNAMQRITQKNLNKMAEGLIIKNHPLYQQACTAYNNLSHDPERRAALWCADHSQRTAKVASLGGDSNRLDQLARAYLASLAKTASAFIVGPARFPTERNQKRQGWADQHLEKYLGYIEAVERRAKLAAQPPALTLAERLEQARAKRARIQATPSGQRQHGSELAYATRAVADLEKQASAVERLAPPAGAIYQADAVRVWFTFNGKPDAATITLLKSKAFKWTPSKGHWGRKLTLNALLAAQVISKNIKEKQA